MTSWQDKVVADTAPAAIRRMDHSTLSPLLTVLDGMLGHSTPLLPPPPPADEEARALESATLATWDLARALTVHVRFLASAHGIIQEALRDLGVKLMVLGDAGTSTQLCLASDAAGAPSDSSALSRAHVRSIVALVEARLAVPSVVLDRLQGITEHVMHECVSRIVASEVGRSMPSDIAAKVRACEVRPGAFFNEEWSTGMETAWQASGAEGILTMPNYKLWTEKHARHRMRSWRSAETDGEVPWGRLWRFEYWECIRTPCHEVVHLVQHYLEQRMTHQLAEHDGAFATYVLMMALQQVECERGAPASAPDKADTADEHKTDPDTAAKAAADTDKSIKTATVSDAGPVYYPGAVEEAIGESADYCRVFHTHATEEARERWDEASREEYTKWRDGFGATDMSDTRWGSAGNFGAQMAIENLCKNMVALEAICPSGKVVDGPEEIKAVTEGMLTTMFRPGRTGVLDGVSVDIEAAVKLSGMAVGDRLEGVLALSGSERARALLLELKLVTA